MDSVTARKKPTARASGQMGLGSASSSTPASAGGVPPDLRLANPRGFASAGRVRRERRRRRQRCRLVRGTGVESEHSAIIPSRAGGGFSWTKPLEAASLVASASRRDPTLGSSWAQPSVRPPRRFEGQRCRCSRGGCHPGAARFRLGPRRSGTRWSQAMLRVSFFGAGGSDQDLGHRSARPRMVSRRRSVIASPAAGPRPGGGSASRGRMQRSGERISPRSGARPGSRR